MEDKDKLVREKLVARGIENLSDNEVLSLLIESQTSSSLSLAENLLKNHNNSLNTLSSQSLAKLRLEQGLGIKNSVKILAAIELGKRVAAQQSKTISKIETNQDIYDLFRPLLSNLPHEEFWVLYLNATNGIIDKAKVSQGGVSSTSVDHKLIIKRAVELLASGLVLVHNHPSGSATPSEQDVELTRKLALGASLFEINVLDHIIISSSENASLKQLGLL